MSQDKYESSSQEESTMEPFDEPLTADDELADSPNQEGAGVQKTHRVLHVIVPAHVFNHAKAQAALSGLPFKVYMKQFLEEAFPYLDPDGPKRTTT